MAIKSSIENLEKALTIILRIAAYTSSKKRLFFVYLVVRESQKYNFSKQFPLINA